MDPKVLTLTHLGDGTILVGRKQQQWPSWTHAFHHEPYEPGYPKQNPNNQAKALQRHLRFGWSFHWWINLGLLLRFLRRLMLIFIIILKQNHRRLLRLLALSNPDILANIPHCPPLGPIDHLQLRLIQNNADAIDPLLGFGFSDPENHTQPVDWADTGIALCSCAIGPDAGVFNLCEFSDAKTLHCTHRQRQGRGLATALFRRRPPYGHDQPELPSRDSDRWIQHHHACGNAGLSGFYSSDHGPPQSITEASLAEQPSQC